MRDGLPPVFLGQLVVLVALAGFTFGVAVRDVAVMGACATLIGAMGTAGAFRFLGREREDDTDDPG